jgi:hypothetical protein
MNTMTRQEMDRPHGAILLLGPSVARHRKQLVVPPPVLGSVEALMVVLMRVTGFGCVGCTIQDPTPRNSADRCRLIAGVPAMRRGSTRIDEDGEIALEVVGLCAGAECPLLIVGMMPDGVGRTSDKSIAILYQTGWLSGDLRYERSANLQRHAATKPYPDSEWCCLQRTQRCSNSIRSRW